MTIDEAREHIGHGVTYLAGTYLAERGMITSVNESYVFVRYGDGTGLSQATSPEDLTLLAATKTEEG